MSDRLSASQWSRFWTRGTPTTFVGRFSENYDGPVKAFWFDLFSTLPYGASFVDLGTGNGGLAMLVLEYSDRGNRAFSVTGVDYADIDPPRQLANKPFARRLRRIRFLPRTRIEHTGLPTNSQDCAISQFGFEYADRAAAVSEVNRIVKQTDGAFAAMIHHQNSAIIRQANEGIKQIIACEKSGLHALIAELVKRLDRLQTRQRDPQNDATARKLRERINEVVGALDQHASRYQDAGQLRFYLTNSLSVFRSSVARKANLEQKLMRLREVTAETTAYRQRMRDLIASAQSDADIADLVERLKRVGFNIESNEALEFEGVHFCGTLTARR